MNSNRPVVTIGGAIAIATGQLRSAGLPSPRLDAEVLLGFLLGLSRTRLAIDADTPITPEVLARFDDLVERRLEGQPVAYLTETREFMGHEFAVGPGVLVPRPETELLVELGIEMLERLWPAGTVNVLDLCTGSGAIALSLALAIAENEGPEALHYDRGRILVTGSDISTEALDYARRNRSSLGLANLVVLVQGDLLSWTDGPWDLILTNPPYLRPDQIDGNSEIASEPRLALDGGENGVELIERILDQAVGVVAPRFGMIIELDPDHADAVRSLAAARFPGAHVIIRADLTGRNRFVSIERKESVA